uniref:Anthranilate synthase component 2 n=1 Tax=Pleurostichidium falkenbergii TaxID=121064 RepID=A0A4D6UYH9_9FLOR|nr:Anthranilate synthase component II [Pleurostichidium falkenbergii]QCH39590.1 Anthranilate synthase component II [Pleurostichidium falkenbergii]
MIVLIDNYDSFTQNLAQYIGDLGYAIKIARNDELLIQDINQINPTHIILSPGPGKPENSNICLEIIRTYSNKIPILGICLGHQAIGYIYGGIIKKLAKPMHGKTSMIINNQEDIFKNITASFEASRYHSLIVDKNSFPKNLEITAWTSDGEIMGCRHKIYRKLRGIQFHPESLWTQQGKFILSNFLLN